MSRCWHLTCHTRRMGVSNACIVAADIIGELYRCGGLELAIEVQERESMDESQIAVASRSRA